MYSSHEDPGGGDELHQSAGGPNTLRPFMRMHDGDMASAEAARPLKSSTPYRMGLLLLAVLLWHVFVGLWTRAPAVDDDRSEFVVATEDDIFSRSIPHTDAQSWSMMLDESWLRFFFFV